jgi:hypothetical protein
MHLDFVSQPDVDDRSVHVGDCVVYTNVAKLPLHSTGH